MNQSERFHTMHQLLRQHKAVSRETFLERLEVSKATFKRDLEFMRSRLHAPIEYSPKLGGYRYSEQSEGSGPVFDLPHLWFNESEVYALLTMHRLLQELQPGLLEAQVGPLRKRLEEILADAGHDITTVTERIKLLHAGKRRIDTGMFESVARAVLARERLEIIHFNKETGATTVREVSPQYLCLYHDNYLVDTWCHMREGIRTFDLDGIRRARRTGEPAIDVPKQRLEEHLASGYGIFGGKESAWAKLKFTQIRSRWVMREEWHPKQKSEVLPDDSYVLQVPYSDDRELVMEILKYGPEVEVLEPDTLRDRIIERLAEALKIYS